MNLFRFMFVLCLFGCGGSATSEQKEPPEENVLSVSYIDELWLPGYDRNIIRSNDELMVLAHSLHTIKLNSHGFIESHVPYPEYTPNNIAVINDSTLVMLKLNSVGMYQYTGGIFDLLYETESVKETSQTILTTHGNCAYWVNGAESESNSRVQRLCKNKNNFTESTVYETTGYIFNVKSLGNGLFALFEGLGSLQYIRLFDENFIELDSIYSSESWNAADPELLNDVLYFDGYRKVWKVNLVDVKFGEAMVLEEYVPETGRNGTRLIASGDNLLITALDENIQLYQMKGDQVVKQHKVQLSYVIDSIYIDGEFLIVSYVAPFDESSSIGIQTYKIADLLNAVE